MGKVERERGRSFEYRVVALARRRGLQARRIPVSGAGSEKLDVEIGGIRFECKYRSKGIGELMAWLEKAVEQGGAGVVVGGGRGRPIAVVYAERLFELLSERG